jgi:hypothetical protein
MALYGQAYVNGLEIVDWEARRMSVNAHEVNTYVVSVTYTDRNSRLHMIEGQLEHTYSEGALILMSKVFAWAAAEISAEAR